MISGLHIIIKLIDLGTVPSFWRLTISALYLRSIARSYIYILNIGAGRNVRQSVPVRIQVLFRIWVPLTFCVKEQGWAGESEKEEWKAFRGVAAPPSTLGKHALGAGWGYDKATIGVL